MKQSKWQPSGKAGCAQEFGWSRFMWMIQFWLTRGDGRRQRKQRHCIRSNGFFADWPFSHSRLVKPMQSYSALSGLEWPWVALSGLEWPWVALSGIEWPWVALSGLEWPWVALSGLEWPWVALSGRLGLSGRGPWMAGGGLSGRLGLTGQYSLSGFEWPWVALNRDASPFFCMMKKKKVNNYQQTWLKPAKTKKNIRTANSVSRVDDMVI